jgi:hypothetical protein
MQREYKNVIFTKHALERIRKRRMSQDMIVQAIKGPERDFIEEDGDTRFIRDVNGRQVHVVAHYLDDERKWLVKTTWVRGEDDVKPLWQRVLLLPVRLIRLAFKRR